MTCFLYHRRLCSLLLLLFLLLTERVGKRTHRAHPRARYVDTRAERIKKKRESVVFVSRYKNKKYALLPERKKDSFCFFKIARARVRERERGCAPLQRQAQCKAVRMCNHAATVIERYCSSFFYIIAWTAGRLLFEEFFFEKRKIFFLQNQNTTPTYA
jgi:hypothetical protein